MTTLSSTALGVLRGPNWYHDTHFRTGWCGVCDREVTITTMPAIGGKARLWFCEQCGHFLGEEPREKHGKA